MPSGGGTGPASPLAFGHYDASDIGSNLLATLLPQSAGLLPGTCSVWLNETAGTAAYSFDFLLAPCPSPQGPSCSGRGCWLCDASGAADPRRLPRRHVAPAPCRSVNTSRPHGDAGGRPIAARRPPWPGRHPGAQETTMTITVYLMPLLLMFAAEWLVPDR